MAKVCVIIPAYNAEAFIAQAIESVLVQTYNSWQLIVLDDGSCDRTLAIAQAYAQSDPRVTVMSHTNVGVSITRNRGAQSAAPNTQYLLFLDADDYLEPFALELLSAALDRAPEMSGAYGLAREVETNGDPKTKQLSAAFGYVRRKVEAGRIVQLPHDAPTDFATLVLWPSLATPGQLLLRANLFQYIGGHDVTSNLGEDWDLWIRLAACGNLHLVRSIVMNKRHHAANVSNDIKRMRAAETWLRRKVARLPNLTAEQRQAARAGHLYSCLIKLGWVRSDLRERRIVAALKTAYRALVSFVGYVRTPYQV